MSTQTLRRLEAVALVGVGGFAGANLRYAAALLWPGLPGTLAVNAAGSLALGFIVYEAAGRGVLADESRTVLATGFLSSLTTYSTFAVQTAQSAPVWMVANVLGNYALGFLGVVVGRWLAVTYGGGR
ncbi:fluoride efflux transporter FluC [Halobacterium litoreum]|uniref:Fluoride-specific ion channel FluC n=1 Tax=Halobacterium litoreum TaxID=2039234 RepID=A0ABD5NDV3_9EURY|nr:CrcB family protein [Halobacterium litoreum]UHH13744.1 CrcB family protein [Halobacterium litoreum]